MTTETFLKAISGTQFANDLLSSMNINGATSSLGMYQLIVQKSAVKLYAKIGMKPNRHWKITDVKRYFGIKGTAQQMYEILETYFEFIKDKKIEAI